jgi:DNA-binding GntR family transcriptional regulator
MKTPLPRVQQGRVLTNTVRASLREAILKGHFEFGERIDQDKIAQELEVSRTPIREALQSLEQEGLVQIRPHYGAFIPIVTPDDVREVYEVRALLESEVVRRVTLLVPEDLLDALDRLQADSQSGLDSGDIAKSFDSDVRFHQTFVDLVDNRLIKDVLDGLTNRISMVRRLAQSKPGVHLPESVSEHRAIIRAIRRRDAEAAARLMARHLSTSSLRIQELARGLECNKDSAASLNLGG